MILKTLLHVLGLHRFDGGHDGRLGLYKNVYRKGIGERYITHWPGHDKSDTELSREDRKEGEWQRVAVSKCRVSLFSPHCQIGLKPAGGVRTVKEAIPWMILIKETLGDDWLQPELFRFGASGLLNDIESIIYS